MTSTGPTAGTATHDGRAARRAERRADRLDDPRFEGLRTRPARRRLVTGLVGLLVVEALLFLSLDVVGSGLGAVAVAVGVGVLIVSFVLLLGMLKASTRGVEELPRSVLDEREQQVRGEVYVRSYRIGFVALTLLLGAAWVWQLTGWPAGAGVLTAAVVVTFHVALVLPTLVAAWLSD